MVFFRLFSQKERPRNASNKQDSKEEKGIRRQEEGAEGIESQADKEVGRRQVEDGTCSKAEEIEQVEDGTCSKAEEIEQVADCAEDSPEAGAGPQEDGTTFAKGQELSEDLRRRSAEVPRFAARAQGSYR